MTRLDDLFGNRIVRFDDEEENDRRQAEASAAAARLRNSQPPPALPPPVIVPQPDYRTDWPEVAPSSAAPGGDDEIDREWHTDLPDDTQRMYAIVVQEKALTLEEMHRVAQALCGDEWNEQLRAGKHPELWLPGKIANLIIRSVEKRLRSSRVSQDPELVENFQQVAAELLQAKAEMDGLRQRLHSAETAVREMKEAALKEALRKQKYAEEKAQTGYVKQRVSSPPRAPVAAPRAAEPALSLSKGDAPPVVVAENDLDADGDEDVTPEKSNERRDDVVRVIAESGLCRAKDVRAALAKKWGLQKDNAARRPIELAVKAGLIDVHQAKLEWGGKDKGNIFALTAQGRDLAKSLGVKLIKGQYERGMALHKNESHLYLILEVAEILRDNGYGDVDPFPPSMTLPGGGNRQYQPDIKARMPSPENAIILIEVERDTFKAADRDDRSGKWLRAAEAGRGVIHLVAPNRDTLAKIVNEIDEVRKQNSGQKMLVRAFSVSDFQAQKKESGVGVSWELKIESGAAR